MMRRWAKFGTTWAQRGTALAAVLMLISLLPAGLAAAVPRASGLALSVRPAVGAVRAHFTVSFTAQLTGFGFPDTSAYQLVVTGGGPPNCRSAQRISIPPTSPGQRVHVVLSPSAPSGLWCRGSYTGRLQELFQSVCGAGVPCPLIARPRPSLLIVKTLQTFHFRVG